MSYKKLTAVEKAGFKTRHRSERDKRICDRIKAVLLYDDGYKLLEIAKILLLSHEGVRKHLEAKLTLCFVTHGLILGFY